ncbi:D-lyxose/D-mannose family sugar isomerase [Mixta mediterraneensis]|uniref:D-lyxose/D-mannose isomerase n=1 Tax=Mixta mediterraneensis TaxID=2758443 RepID=UPI001874656B|nr:D-lyxose/D-mannose family sugar isomerase [Mixta mediterraneensis]MBE5252505.1 D-lyxose/D-mannose family sugar isomerase [Mixta mediterraneensis]
MQRSEVNAILQRTREFFMRQDVHLPPWADYGLHQWREVNREAAEELLTLHLGWDVTSFGEDDFRQTGLTLFTLRNGSPGGKPWHKPYAEKIMHVREGQVTPMHYHPQKMEDIINRGGGNVIVTLYNRAGAGLADTPVSVTLDGISQTHAAGTQLRLSPGESVTLEPGIWHSFWGEDGFGDVLVGEVSMPNDDENDNVFLTSLPRFNPVDEDEEPRWLLCNEYRRWLA